MSYCDADDFEYYKKMLDFIDVDVTNLDAHLKSYALGLLARLALGACLNLKGVNLVVKVHQVGGIIIVCGRAVIFFRCCARSLLW